MRMAVFNEEHPNGIVQETVDTENIAEEADVASVQDPLTEMASAMAKATSLAQMRAAAKAFLEQTGEEQ